MTLFSKSFLAVAALALAPLSARAQVTISGSEAQDAAAVANGLNGTYWQAPAGSTNEQIGSALAYIAANQAVGTFSTTEVNYNGVDDSSLAQFLDYYGTNGSNYSGTTGFQNSYAGLSDGILQLTGYLYVGSPGTVTISSNHDDAVQVSIGGTVVVSAGCCGTTSESVTFTHAGWYALDLTYLNSEYNNFSGQAYVTLSENGQIISNADLATSVVPEPATLALLAGGLASLSLLRRRARA